MEKGISPMIYAVAMALGFAVLIIGLWTGSWDFGYWLSNPTVILALAISEIVARILSGFGLLLTYLLICEEILLRLSTTLKSKRKTAKRVFSFLMFIPVALLIYSAVRVFFAWFYTTSTTLLDVIYLLAGMWGLIISVYLLPISRGEFSMIAQRTDLQTAESRAKKLGRKVKRFYHERIRKHYAEAYRIDIERIRERLNAHRVNLGTAILLPFALGSLVLPPITLLFIVLFVKGSICRSGEGYGLTDRSILAVAIIAAGVFVSIQIYASLGSPQLMLDIGYLIGALMGYITFLYFVGTIL